MSPGVTARRQETLKHLERSVRAQRPSELFVFRQGRCSEYIRTDVGERRGSLTRNAGSGAPSHFGLGMDVTRLLDIILLRTVWLRSHGLLRGRLFTSDVASLAGIGYQEIEND